MADKAGAQAGEVVPVANGGPAMIRPELAEAIAMLVYDIPESDSDAFDSIIGAILQANDYRDVDAPWRSAGLEQLLNEPIEVRSIRKRPSDFKDGMPFYLLVTGAIVATGEVFTATTGAASVVAQLAKFHSLGAFPVRVIPRQADRPSARGYFPMHLEVVQP